MIKNGKDLQIVMLRIFKTAQLISKYDAEAMLAITEICVIMMRTE